MITSAEILAARAPLSDVAPIGSDETARGVGVMARARPEATA